MLNLTLLDAPTPSVKDKFSRTRCGFSLIEVVLAIGIFLVTVLALVGLLGPTLQSVVEVENTDEVTSVVNTVNAFLQNSPEIAPLGQSKFDEIFNAVVGDGYATLFVFRQFNAQNAVSLKVGFFGETNATIVNSDVTDGTTVNATGSVFRVVLTPSSVTPTQYLVGGDSATRNADGIYALSDSNIDNYFEGYFAIEVRIYAEDPSPNFNGANLPPYSGRESLQATPTNLDDIDPIFTYNTAIVR